MPALAIIVHTNIERRDIEKARVREGALSLSRLAAAKEEKFLKNTRQLLATLNQFPFLLVSTNRAFTSTALSNLQKLSPDYTGFGLIETNGELFCKNDNPDPHVNVGHRAYFRRVIETQKFSVGDFVKPLSSREPTLSFGYPVFDESGRLLRVLYASIKANRFSEAISDLDLPEGACVTVLDSAGTVLARVPNPQLWVGGQASNNPTARAIVGATNSEFDLTGLDQVQRHIAVTKVLNEGKPSLYVAVEVPLNVLFARANAALTRSLLALASVSFIIWLVVQLYARRYFLRPMNSLSAAARRLAAGDLSARAGNLSGAEELVQLGAALDEMAETEQQRTAELIQANEILRAEIAERQRAEQRIKEQEQEKKKLEEQFLRSQRMESIGALAGGIAHDLNNALVPVVMGAEMLLEGGGDSSETEKLLQLITTSGKRCTEMVKQIVGFARGTRGKAGPVPLRQLVNEVAGIARETFPKTIVTEVSADPTLWNVEGDPTEFHQVLLNLCVNARDAMPKGGRLVITASNVTVGPGDPTLRGEAKPGSYVQLTVADTGVGIPPELQARIFEPFFTTKTPDKGTGLGLSTVATIVRRNKGLLDLESEVGKGTKFKISLPAKVASETAKQETQAQPPAGQGETILLADDEQMVLELSKTTLENYGYKVLTATNGLEAVSCFERNKEAVRLLVIDTDMPFMDGMDAIRKIRRLAPSLPVVLASATKQDTAILSRSEYTQVAVLPKPYGVDQLLRTVAKALREEAAGQEHSRSGGAAAGGSPALERRATAPFANSHEERGI
ncbi:MAG TPA: ATP-binding protein [Verrucomicrobiae bacterium]|nr:ATP-binding protein [Verrucomicrobiae bacterium]